MNISPAIAHNKEFELYYNCDKKAIVAIPICPLKQKVTWFLLCYSKRPIQLLSREQISGQGAGEDTGRLGGGFWRGLHAKVLLAGARLRAAGTNQSDHNTFETWRATEKRGIITRFGEKAMAPHSSTLAWKIPGTEEPGGLLSMGSHRVGHEWATSLSLFSFMHWRRDWQPTPVFLPGESQGQRSLVGCRLWGFTESDTTEAT